STRRQLSAAVITWTDITPDLAELSPCGTIARPSRGARRFSRRDRRALRCAREGLSSPRMRIASWNVNSIRPRMEQLTSWLVRARPDVVCLQETKVEDDKFPAAEIGDAGYSFVHFGQRTYNGVAILARFGLALDDVKRNLDDDPADAHRRL